MTPALLTGGPPGGNTPISLVSVPVLPQSSVTVKVTVKTPGANYK